MKQKIIITIYLFILMQGIIFGNDTKKEVSQNDSITLREYSFNIFPSTLNLFTMEQMDEDYLSTSRLLNRSIETVIRAEGLIPRPLGRMKGIKSRLQYL